MPCIECSGRNPSVFGGILPDLLSNDKVFSIFPQLKSCNIHNLLLDIEKVLCYNGQQVKKNRWKTRRKKIMNNLERTNLIRREKLDEQNYFQSFLQEFSSKQLISAMSNDTVLVLHS